MPGNENERAAILGQLKFPLVFFGLALLVMEATFGAILVRGGESERVTIYFGCLMAGVFLITVLIVGFLTFLAPGNLMLLPQDIRSDDPLKEATKHMYLLQQELNRSHGKQAEAEAQ